ncbi:MAG: trypsin-like peptidase domain-containing protein [Pseudobacteriovorax sp.]|nr:trypsin-like peptidase domain-containing protein [Pseudobacteriovorax sp.]
MTNRYVANITRRFPWFAALALANLLYSCSPSNHESVLTNHFSGTFFERNDLPEIHYGKVLPVGSYKEARGGAIIPLTARYGITARHVTLDRYSGFALTDSTPFTIKKVIESYEDLDIAVIEYAWPYDQPPKNLSYVRSYARLDELSYQSSSATEIVTMGFPADRQKKATIALGFLKDYKTVDPFSVDHLYFNAGAAPGQSGGPIFQADNQVLVGVLTGGPHAPWQPEFTNNNPEDSLSWNWGILFADVVDRSPLLQEIFINGINRFVNSDGTLRQDANCNLDAGGLLELCSIPPENREFFDGETNLRWQLRPLTGVTRNQAQTLCSAPWRLPSSTELRQAHRDGELTKESSHNGLAGTLNAFKINKFWVSDPSPRFGTSIEAWGNYPTQDAYYEWVEQATLCVLKE